MTNFAIRTSLAASAAIVAIATATPGQAQTKAFNVPSQAAVTGITELARQADVQILVSEAAVRGKRTNAVRGKMTFRRALDALLAGTGLRIAASDGRTYTLAINQTAAVGGPVEETTAAETDESADPIVVTGSRIDRSGSETPTRVAQYDSEKLNQAARGNIALALQDQPQFKASNSPANSGGSTAPAVSPIDIRGLSNQGQSRTLVLVDGRRYMGATTFLGSGDLSLIPSSLVKRVDVVLGGASAAWGSGAVAGVANVIIDGGFTGARANARAGISSRGDASERSVDLAFGTGFADDRGHFLIGGEFIDSDGVIPKVARANAGRWALVTNPAYTPTNGQQPNLLAPNVGIANASPGGLILSGVNAGKTFNDDGSLRPFNLGRVSGSSSIGGEAPSNDDIIALVAPYKRYAALGRLTYELSDGIKATAELRHARAFGNFATLPDVSRGNITIGVNNAFLPAAVRAQMLAAGETSFTMGRFNADIATTMTDFERKSTEAVLALDGRFGKNWRWTAYYTHGQLNENTNLSNQRMVPNLNRAIDSVINPANGQPVCRVNIDADPSNNDPACVPINVFGVGNVSQQARDYVTATGFFHSTRKLDAMGVSLRGEPIRLWAGPVSIAVGAEARRDFLRVDVSQYDIAKQLGSVNQAPFPARHMWTKEGFAEVLIPVLRDVPLARLTELNGAVRVTNDLSGSVWSWKVGLVNRISDAIRIRLAHSRDIRSPALSELFAPIAQVTLANILDPTRGNQVFLVQTFSGRAGPLLPETSKTTSAGVTISPVRGLSVSADYYDITIDGSIGTVSPQNQVIGCFRGFTAFCAGVNRDANGILTGVVGSLVNLSQFKTSGIDGQLDYVLPVPELGGTLRFQSNINWVRRFQTTDTFSTVQYVGMTGSQFSLAVPRVRWNTGLYFDADSFHANVRTRFISRSKYDRNLAIQNNDRPAYMYLDLGASVDVTRGETSSLSIYANINNVLDKAPPIESRNTSFYDVIGRYFAIGARLKY